MLKINDNYLDKREGVVFIPGVSIHATFNQLVNKYKPQKVKRLI